MQYRFLLTLPLLFFSFSSCLYAEVQLSTQSWSGADFAQMESDLAVAEKLNFLNFPGAKIVEASGIPESKFGLLTDGHVGQFGGEGRVDANGKPARLLVYLGAPRSIKAISVYSGNIDSRANQDYEIRLANNAANPGEKPTFASAADYTTGDKILGSNSGGFRTTFREAADGKFLAAQGADGGADAKYDWVEFRFWETYPSQAGNPGKANSPANSWTSLVEIQVLGDETDDALYASPEEKAAVMRQFAMRRLEQKLASINSVVLNAYRNMQNVRDAIEDIEATYGDEYEGEAYLEELAKFEKERDVLLNAQSNEEMERLIQSVARFDAFRRKVLLKNPLLKFDRVLVRTSQHPYVMENWMSNCSRGKGPYNNQLQILRLSDPEAKLEPIIQAPRGSFIGDICLHWDAKRLLVTALSENDTWEVFEVQLDKPTEFRQVTPFLGRDVDNVEGCYLPDGAFLFVSSASMMGVPCIAGAGHVGNIFRVEADGKTTRQLTFEQDQDWCPVVLNNGRVMYLRWEYVDTNHYFTRIIMHMNPDGSNQIEYYGSNSFWPNSMFNAKPLPNSAKFVTIVTGHHGEAQRQGELYIMDPSLGRQETDGVVQQIPFRNRKPEAKILDQLVVDSWPRFMFPFPLSENYFLVSCRTRPDQPWGLYLVDTFDNMLLIKESPEFGIFEAQPLMERPTPPIVASRLVEGDPGATVFLTDVYFGNGLKNVPTDQVKQLRLFTYQYGYRGIGNHDMIGIESSWDSKILLGDVPVYEDGSASFRIPANTPIAVQPLDKDGNALQLMRSWLVGVPGEGVTCAGCHESQNSATPAKRTLAMTKPPVEIAEFNGEARPIGFRREIQPVLDRYCVGCHDGSEPGRPNLKEVGCPEGIWGGHYSRSYIDLMPFIRRPGPESDVHMFNPMEYHTNTSPLFQMLRDGHHYNVKMDDVSWRELRMWVDLNVPFFATWTEVSQAYRGNSDGVRSMADRTREIRSLYANLHEDPEHGSNVVPDRPEFIKPEEWVRPDTTLSADAAAVAAVNRAVPPEFDGSMKEVEVEDGIKLELVKIPAGRFPIGDDCGNPDETGRNVVTIEKPFYLMTTEVTNALYSLFDPQHDSRFIDQQWKDHCTPGYPHCEPQQPVIRVSWEEATAFCKWLSEKTGRKFRLPTEAEWEWAAKAGQDKPFWWGGVDADFGAYANLADRSLRLFVVDGINPQPKAHYQDWEAFLPRIDSVDDGQMYPGWDTKTHFNTPPSAKAGKATACYKPNPWGLYDMNGNVCEWTQSDYKPYPYDANDGRNAGDVSVEKVARGGSWFDRPKTARSGYRLPYHAWQRVYNVGFRVVMEEE